MPVLRFLRNILRHIDLVLLALCLAASTMSLILVYSATRYDTRRYGDVKKLVIFVCLGVVAYVIFNYLDVDLILEKSWLLLFVLSVILLLMLIPFGFEDKTGNRNWMYLPGITIGIQPAEVVKLFFVPMLAWIIDRNRE